MNILGIETSCDETSASIVSNGRNVLSFALSSSMDQQSKYGGIFPEVAARRQIECMIPVLKKALDESSIPRENINAIAVTHSPGLLSSLLVGVMTARSIASAWQKPLIGIHHTLGHLSSIWLGNDDEILFPTLSLSVSGGHTELWFRRSHMDGDLLGKTIDDAAGEAFDKGATMLELGYPGGPALSEHATNGNPQAIDFPLPLSSEDTLDFSFSGLKTSLKYHIRDRGGLSALTENERSDIAASYQEAICSQLGIRVARALKRFPIIQELHLVGGVSANERLRAIMQHCCGDSVRLRVPSHMKYCTDNAAMIAAAGEFMLREKGNRAFEYFSTDAVSRLILKG